MNSKELIGRVRDRYNEMDVAYNGGNKERWRGDEFRTFYAGWIEGRIDMRKHTRKDIKWSSFALGAGSVIALIVIWFSHDIFEFFQ